MIDPATIMRGKPYARPYRWPACPTTCGAHTGYAASPRCADRREGHCPCWERYIKSWGDDAHYLPLPPMYISVADSDTLFDLFGGAA